MFLRRAPCPPGAATLVLLHGWTSTADINWFTAYDALAAEYALVAPDLRGHGRGPRDGRTIVGIGDLAHDVAALIDHLVVAPVIVVGYSMGSAVAQLLARDHPDAVAGLVLCAGARRLARTPVEHVRLIALRVAAAVASLLPDVVPATVAIAVMRAMYGNDPFQRWILSVSQRHRWRDVLALGAALDGFDSRPWVASLGTPAAVVVTARDRYVAAGRQFELAAALRAPAFVADGHHAVCLGHPDRLQPPLLDACHAVADEIRDRAADERTA
jgi:pimeloyl-ACP methyl ester carboxylesterase